MLPGQGILADAVVLEDGVVGDAIEHIVKERSACGGDSVWIWFVAALSALDFPATGEPEGRVVNGMARTLWKGWPTTFQCLILPAFHGMIPFYLETMEI